MRQDITIADGTIVHTLDAFPFDSSPNLVTTEQGYRRGDRAVDAWTMQRTFRQFFSDGVFGTPADAFQIGKAESGLAVTVQPGMAIIEGGMGGIKDSDGPLVVTLDTGAAAGNVCYGIMLRYDNNSDVRSLGIRAVKGVAGSNPQPPEPDTTSAGVKEIRLGYVTVPNGATDLTNATVTNEKGLDACPYAAPFAEIDLSAVTAQAIESADAALSSLLAYFNAYKGAVDAALDDSEATYLQGQISQLQEQISSFDLSDSVDNETIKYAIPPLGSTPKLSVIEGAIVNFTDSVTADEATSDKMAATPACVDAKIADTYSRYIESGRIHAVSNWMNFTRSQFESNGFTMQSDGFTVQHSQAYVLAIGFEGNAAPAVYVNGEKVIETSGYADNNQDWTIAAILYLDEGDKVRVGGSNTGQYDLIYMTMRGV